MTSNHSETTRLLQDLQRYVAGSLPTHMARGGEADRQSLLLRLEATIARKPTRWQRFCRWLGRLP